MKTLSPDKIRNVALIGHGGAGKTTLAEALLACSGAIGRMGRVEDGTTTTDFEPEEHRRGLSLSLALAPFEHDGHKVNLIDTPGYADFAGDVAAALSVVDLAVLVVSAVDGVEVQTERYWRMAEAAGVPRMVFVNKCDRERASFGRVLESLREHFGTGLAPVELPLGEEASLRGVVDLLADVAIVYDSVGGGAQVGSGHGSGAHTEPIPPEMAEQEHQVREALVEGIVVGDDALVERYLEGEELTTAELAGALAHGVANGSVFPVVCGSATLGIGIERLADLICELGPTAASRPPVEVEAGDQSQQVAPDPSGEPLAVVYKTLADPYVGKVSLLKVVSGTIRPDTVLTNPRTHADERLHTLFALRGKEHDEVTEAPAGDLVAVAKLTDTSTGDTLAPKTMPVLVPLAPLPPPVLSIAIRPRSKGDEDKLMTALHRLQDEDPSVSVRRDDETHQTVLSGMGDTHLSVAAERLHRKFGVDVETEDLLVAYRETITTAAEAEGKYKKQTGGHGQYGVCHLRLAPLGRGEGFAFVDKVVGGAIPRQFIPAVEKGLVEAMSLGGVHGFPVVDVEVTCDDGKYHPVDSSEMSFKMAASLGFKEALAKASPVVLEPISMLSVTVPSAYQGDVLGDLNSRRGRVQGTDVGAHGQQTVVALVPTSEITRYAIDLRSLTGGRGSFSVTHDHYDVLPAHMAARLPMRGE
ncbi:MAG: elongation factor G [Acidimicrobiales bacterium]